MPPSISAPAEGDYISNVRPDYNAQPGEMIGAPRATDYFSVEQLVAAGVAGLYRRGPQR